ncbi:hypothetical protein C8Q74DRAFT_1217079 [Fomes fomentarius]|nr:hypothetical protein C8Q74DRAFT_1217079 [Fomes fomentarius]
MAPGVSDALKGVEERAFIEVGSYGTSQRLGSPRSLIAGERSLEVSSSRLRCKHAPEGAVRRRWRHQGASQACSGCGGKDRTDSDSLCELDLHLGVSSRWSANAGASDMRLRLGEVAACEIHHVHSLRNDSTRRSVPLQCSTMLAPYALADAPVDAGLAGLSASALQCTTLGLSPTIVSYITTHGLCPCVMHRTPVSAVSQSGVSVANAEMQRCRAGGPASISSRLIPDADLPAETPSWTSPPHRRQTLCVRAHCAPPPDQQLRETGAGASAVVVPFITLIPYRAACPDDTPS